MHITTNMVEGASQGRVRRAGGHGSRWNVLVNPLKEHCLKLSWSLRKTKNRDGTHAARHDPHPGKPFGGCRENYGEEQCSGEHSPLFVISLVMPPVCPGRKRPLYAPVVPHFRKGKTRMNTRTFMLAALVTMLCVNSPSWSATHTVAALDYQPWYEPVAVMIDVGDTVAWMNPSVHTVTHEDFFTTGKPAFHKLLGPGEGFTHTFETSGTYEYLCAYHPWMRGKVVVRPGRVSPVKRGEIWVAAQFQSAIQIIDSDINQVVDYIPVGNNPHNIAFTPDGRFAYVSSWHEDEVWKIDVTKREVIKSITVGPAPAHVLVAPAGKIYVSVMGADYVAVIDANTDTVIGKVTIGQGPHGMGHTPDWTSLVVVEAHGARAAIVDVDQGKPKAHVPVGVLPLGLGITPDGSKAYIANGFSGTVSILNLKAQTKIKDLDVGGLPVDAAVHPQGHLALVPNKREGVVHVIDTGRDVVIRDIPTGKGAHGVRFSLDGHAAYVSNTFDNWMSVIDMETFSTTNIPLWGGPNTSGAFGIGVLMAVPHQ